MPVRSFEFSFRLDAKELLEYVTSHNIGVTIQATGTKKSEATEAQVVAKAVPALPPPTERQPQAQELVLAFMARHPKEKYSTAVIQALLVQCHRSPNSTGNVIFLLTQGKWIKNLNNSGRKGEYKITAKGLKRVEGIQ